LFCYNNDVKVVIIITIALIALSAYSVFTFARKVRVARELVRDARPFELVGPLHTGTSLLMLGDSTAVGVGATKPEESLTGLIAKHIEAASVENRAFSGARVRDLATQVRDLSRDRYSVIVVGIGANDIIRFGSAKNTTRHLRVILEGLPKHDRLVVYMAGNVGATDIFPIPFRFIYTRLTMQYHRAYEEMVPQVGGVYVNLYAEPAPPVRATHCGLIGCDLCYSSALC
jgi:lysophospholipase L1-like esterase